MPRVRTPVAAATFGISTLRTAAGMYSPANSACFTFGQCACSQGLNSDTVSPSTPRAPAFFTTRS
jgi:hypothetical protein